MSEIERSITNGFSILEVEELFQINGGAEQTVEQSDEIETKISTSATGAVKNEPNDEKIIGEGSVTVEYEHKTTHTTTVTTTQTVPDSPVPVVPSTSSNK